MVVAALATKQDTWSKTQGIIGEKHVYVWAGLGQDPKSRFFLPSPVDHLLTIVAASLTK